MDEMYLWMTFRAARSWMNVVAAKVASDVESILDGKVGEILIAECFILFSRVQKEVLAILTNHLSLSDEESQLIFSGVRQLAQLYAMNFGTNVRSQVGNFSVLQQIGKARICILAVLIVLEGFQRRISDSSVSRFANECGKTLLASCRSTLEGSLGTWQVAAFPYPLVQHPLERLPDHQ
jgi:hypothetical protein